MSTKFVCTFAADSHHNRQQTNEQTILRAAMAHHADLGVQRAKRGHNTNRQHTHRHTRKSQLASTQLASAQRQAYTGRKDRTAYPKQVVQVHVYWCAPHRGWTHREAPRPQVSSTAQRLSAAFPPLARQLHPICASRADGGNEGRRRAITLVVGAHAAERRVGHRTHGHNRAGIEKHHTRVAPRWFQLPQLSLGPHRHGIYDRHHAIERIWAPLAMGERGSL